MQQEDWIAWESSRLKRILQEITGVNPDVSNQVTTATSSKRSFGLVDQKLTEAEFFLEKIKSAEFPEILHYFSAFVTACRSITFASQAVMSNHAEYMSFYSKWVEEFKNNKTARYFIECRNLGQKTGESPVSGGTIVNGRVTHLFHPSPEFPRVPSCSVEQACDEYFKLLLNFVYECYICFGEELDPQQYFTQESFHRRMLTVDDADLEVFGIYGWTSGIPELERWRLLREAVGGTGTEWIFEKYLGSYCPAQVRILREKTP